MIDLNEKPLCTIPRVMCRAVDNLELLLSQPDESVDLIYCDILYGTGKDFMDYKDLLPMRKIIEEHYLPRLKEMHRVLKSTGSIYLQMDYRIVHWVRCLMDDIFSYGNFKNEIIWHYRTMKNDTKSFKEKHDNILFYSKSTDYCFNSDDIRIEHTEATKKRYKRAKSGFTQGELKDKGKIPNDVWDDCYLVNNQFKRESVCYATQKPKVLIERIIKASSNKGDTVADYYLGSGTTAVVCKELNRNFIGCDINPKAIEITNARLDAVS
jgi:DNA modification methylase